MDRMRSLICLLYFLPVFSAVGSDGFSFTWMKNKQAVGHLEIMVNSEDGAMTYDYISNLDLSAGVDMQVRDEWQAVYSETGILTYLEARNIINGTVRFSITETGQQEDYLRVVNGKAKTVGRPDVKYNYILLFVREPVGIGELYSEYYGSSFEVEVNGNNSYTVTDSRNREHQFNYDDQGRLENAKILLSVGEFTLIRDHPPLK